MILSFSGGRQKRQISSIWQHKSSILLCIIKSIRLYLLIQKYEKISEIVSELQH